MFSPFDFDDSPLLFIVQQSGAEEACWAHNPEVRGSKPRSAKVLNNFSISNRKNVLKRVSPSLPGGELNPGLPRDRRGY